MVKKNTSKRPARKREQLLIIAAITVGVIGTYALTRIKAKEDEISLFNEEIARLRSEVSQVASTRNAEREMEEAQENLAASQSALEATQKELADYTQNLVNVGSSEAVESVMLDITTTAARVGVEIQQAEPFVGQVPGIAKVRVKEPPSVADASSTPAVTTASVDPMAGRPLRKLVMNGSYIDIVNFVTELNRMRTTVRVMSFSLRVGTTKTADAINTQPPQLNAEMLVLL